MRGYRGPVHVRSSGRKNYVRWFFVGMVIGAVGIFILLKLFGASEPVQLVITTPAAPEAKQVSQLKWSDGGDLGVQEPLDQAVVSSPFKVSGMAREQDNAVYVRLTESRKKSDTKNKEQFTLGEATAQANPDKPGLHGPFTTNLTFSSPQGAEGLLEVFGKDKSNKEVDMVSITVHFGK